MKSDKELGEGRVDEILRRHRPMPPEERSGEREAVFANIMQNREGAEGGEASERASIGLLVGSLTAIAAMLILAINLGQRDMTEREEITRNAEEAVIDSLARLGSSDFRTDIESNEEFESDYLMLVE